MQKAGAALSSTKQENAAFGVVGLGRTPPTNPLKQRVSKRARHGCLGLGWAAAMTNARLCLAFGLHVAKIRIPCCPGFRPCNHSFESAVLFSALSSFYSHQK